MRLTVIIAGEPCAPVEVTVMCPVYVPGTRLPKVAEICMVAAVVPLLGDMPSQAESLEAIKLRAPPEPELVTVTEEGVGFEPP